MAEETDMKPFDGTDTLEEPRIEAGRQYLAALQKLGLDPEALFWAEQDSGGFVLVLLTGFFDYVGPLEVSRVLFKAYNASATPKEIDPFIVRLHSPKQTIGKLIRNNLNYAIGPGITYRDLKLTFADLKIWETGIIKHPSGKHSNVAMLGRKWKKIEGNVERLAA